MPLPIVDPEYITRQQLTDAVTMASPMILTILSLLVYAWRGMEKNQDKLSTTLEDHIESDDEIHKEFREDIKALRSQLDHLSGEHDARKAVEQHLIKETNHE